MSSDFLKEEDHALNCPARIGLPRGECLCGVTPQKTGTFKYIPENLNINKEILNVGLLNRETRIVDNITGGEKGSKLQRFSLISPEAEWALAEHYGKGSQKYADRNWELGYKWSLSYDALRRHLNQWQRGESYDQETGSHHLIAVAWHAFCLFFFETKKRGTDDVRGF